MARHGVGGRAYPGSLSPWKPLPNLKGLDQPMPTRVNTPCSSAKRTKLRSRAADSRTAPERGCPHPQHAKPPLAALHSTARHRPDALRVRTPALRPSAVAPSRLGESAMAPARLHEGASWSSRYGQAAACCRPRATLRDLVSQRATPRPSVRLPAAQHRQLGSPPTNRPFPAFTPPRLGGARLRPSTLHPPPFVIPLSSAGGTTGVGRGPEPFPLFPSIAAGDFFD